MSDIDQMISNDGEQLFAELTAAEGANVSGGTNYSRYYIGNKTDIGINYSIKGEKYYLSPGEEDYYYAKERPVVMYDSKIGRGYEVASRYLKPGKNNFDREGKYLFLTTGSSDPVANIAGPVADLKI